MINIRCDKKTTRTDVTNMTDDEIKNLIKLHYKPGINFAKIVEE